jgi:hypothetical protein
MVDDNSTNIFVTNKWWASFLTGFVFAIVSSPASYFVTTTATEFFGGLGTSSGKGANYAGLLLHTIIFILIVRLMLGF